MKYFIISIIVSTLILALFVFIGIHYIFSNNQLDMWEAMLLATISFLLMGVLLYCGGKLDDILNIKGIHTNDND